MNERDYGDQNFCLACGYDFGSTLSENNQDICPCCGAQIGYTYEFNGIGAKEFRIWWLTEERGKWWSSASKPPLDWDFARQMKNIPEELL